MLPVYFPAGWRLWSAALLSCRNVNKVAVVDVGNYLLDTALRHNQYGFDKHFFLPIWSILGFEVGGLIQNVIQL